MSQVDRIASRLSAKKDKAIIEWLSKFEEGERSDAIKEALNAFLSGVIVLFDSEDEQDKLIIEELWPMREQPRKMQAWMKARLFERLTGLDAITGKPLEKFTTVIEKPVIEYVEKPVYIKETVYTQGAMPSSPPDDSEPKNEDVNKEAYNQMGNLDW